MNDDDELAQDHDEPAPVDEAEPVTVDPKARVRKQRRIDFERKQATEFWRGVFENPVGRREMWNILRAAHAFEVKFACGPNGFPQTEATWFALGEQQVGQRIWESWTILDRDGAFRMRDEFDPHFARNRPDDKEGG